MLAVHMYNLQGFYMMSVHLPSPMSGALVFRHWTSCCVVKKWLKLGKWQQMTEWPRENRVCLGMPGTILGLAFPGEGSLLPLDLLQTYLRLGTLFHCHWATELKIRGRGAWRGWGMLVELEGQLWQGLRMGLCFFPCLLEAAPCCLSGDPEPLARERRCLLFPRALCAWHTNTCTLAVGWSCGGGLVMNPVPPSFRVGLVAQAFGQTSAFVPAQLSVSLWTSVSQ